MRSALEADVQRDGATRMDLAAAGALTDCAQSLAELSVAETDSGRIDQIRALEDLKSACAAAQARVTATFAASQRAAAEMMHTRSDGTALDAGAGVDTSTGAGAGAEDGGDNGDRYGSGDGERKAMRASDPLAADGRPSCRRRQAALLRAKALRLALRSASAQVALARRESPALGGRFVGLAEALVHEMPLTLTALAAGVINEARAAIVVRETACLSAEQRGDVDIEIADRFDGLGDSRLQTMVRKIAYRLEPEAATQRAIRAARDRRVSVRPAPDAMAYLTLLLPLTSAVACYGQLRHEADRATSGDARTGAQRMVDIAVERIMQAGRAIRGNADTSVGAADFGPGARHRVGQTDRGDVMGPGNGVAAGSDSPHEDPVASLRAAYAAEPSVRATTEHTAGEAPRGQAPLGHPPGGQARAGQETPGEARAGHPPGGLAPLGHPPGGPAPAGQAPPGEARAGQAPLSHPPGGQAHAGQAPPGEAPAGHPPGRQAPLSHASPDRASLDYTVPNDAVPNDAASGPHGPEADPWPKHTGASNSTGAHRFPPGTGVVVNVVISDSTLFAAGDAPAHLSGDLPIPAPLVRRMIADLPQDARVWIRRLYARPGTGQLVAMDSRRRAFPPAMRRLLLARDADICRTPWCNAPARHADHIRPHAAGGATSVANGQSLSEDCNYIRTAPGWSARPARNGSIVVTTPTGHVYRSPAPEVVVPRRPPTPAPDVSWAESVLQWSLAS